MGKLIVELQAVLGVFPQGNSYMISDYEDIIKKYREVSWQDIFTSVEKQVFQNNRYIDEKDVITPYPIDSWQEKIILSLKNKKSLVVQGPPGSGKSQLILNIIADSLAKNEKILVVCQKKVALEVIYKRLQEKNIEKYISWVNDFRIERNQVFEKVSLLIDSLEEFIEEDKKISTVFLERRFKKVCREIQIKCEIFSHIQKKIFAVSCGGFSAKELYMSSYPLEPHFVIQKDFQNIDAKNIETWLNKVRFLWEESHAVGEKHLYYNRVSFHQFKTEDYVKMIDFIQKIPSIYQELEEKKKKNIQQNLYPALEWILSQKEKLSLLEEIIEIREKNEKLSLIHSNPKADWGKLKKHTEKIITCLETSGNYINNTISKSENEDLIASIKTYTKLHTHFFKKLIFSFSKKYKTIKKNLKNNGLTDITILLQHAKNKSIFEKKRSLLHKTPWIKALPTEYKKAEFEIWLEAYSALFQAKENIISLREKADIPMESSLAFSKIKDIKELCEHYSHYKKMYSTYFTPLQWEKLLGEKQEWKTFLWVIKRDFERICALDKIKNELKPFETYILGLAGHFFESIKTPISIDEKIAILDNSIRMYWLEKIEETHPELRMVSSKELVFFEKELMILQKEKEQLSSEILQLKIKQDIIKNLKYNRLNNRISYREVYYQVNKKRKKWSLRKLVHHYLSDILSVLPCWLVTPETVSTIFPLDTIFDKVIFDEASQCFVEKGIPALFRGKTAVIIGDSKQLSPFDLYQTRWEEENEEINTEVISLLDIGCVHLPQFYLKGHYRSQSPELIAFSNQHFYHNKLKIIPDRNSFNEKKAAIEYLYVKGVWEENKNIKEALTVVSLIEELIKKEQKNIGVITFNQKQQQLILEILEERNINKTKSIFIKNIENVQGEERDIIIFSIGYAPNRAQKMRVNFGILNLEKGENRLNVAITRAKKKIFVVTSIYPYQLQVEETKNEGPKLLKSFLEFSYQVAQKGYRYSLEDKQMEVKNSLKHQIHNKIKNSILSFPPIDLILYARGEATEIMFTDDNYFAEQDIKENIIYTPLILHKKGWKHRRYFSRNFWINNKSIEEIT